MSVSYQADSVDLNDTDGRWSVIDESDYLPAIAASQSMISVPGMDGSLSGTSTLTPPEKTLVLLVAATNDALLKSYVTGLLSLLRGTSTLTRLIDGTVTQSTTVAFKSSQPVEYWPDGTAVVSVTFRLPKVYWRADADDWSQSNPTSGTAYAVSSLANCTGLVLDALVLLTGPVAAGAKVSNSLGEWFKLSSAVAAGSKALVDCAAWTVRIGTDVSYTGGGDLSSGVLSNSGGPYVLRLVPAITGGDPTTTAVTVKLTASGTSSATAIGVRARTAHLL